MNQMYDLIGDIHGYSIPLKALLTKLGYLFKNGCYRHESRTAIFLGDFVDRGPEQRAVINIVKSMVDNKTALAVMGNHEFNALCFHTEDQENLGTYLRPRSDKNIAQHVAFLNEYINNSEELADALAWFKTLPMWLDLEGLRVVHACWDQGAINHIQQNYNKSGLITDDLLVDASHKETEAFRAIETLLKGKEIMLPDTHVGVPDKFGNRHYNIRVKWWNKNINTYKDAFMGPESVLTHIPDDPVNGDHLITYTENDKPVFLGHYWLDGIPKRLTKNIACTDYSVAKPGGKLVAYQWDGEQEIDNAKFVFVENVLEAGSESK